MKRKDERDILFARAGYKKNSRSYNDYYKRNPQKLAFDEKLRERSILGDENSVMYNPLVSSIPFACFDFLAMIKGFSDGDVAENKIVATSEEYTQMIKGLCRYYGAKDVKITKLKDEHYYSHKGRPDAEYGNEILPSYEFGITFYVEMDEGLIDTAPNVTQSVAVTKGYVDAAIIGMVLSYYIRNLGFEARNNMDGNYLFPLPKIFEDAGIGEVGMNGLVITKEYGARIRLGMVSTNLPLIEDKTEKLYIKEFCSLCNRCKNNCPPKAIKDNLEDFDDELCISMWQHFGSDCGICMSSCPFSHTLPEELVKDLSTNINREILAKYCDDNFKTRSMNKNLPYWLDIAYKK